MANINNDKPDKHYNNVNDIIFILILKRGSFAQNLIKEGSKAKAPKTVSFGNTSNKIQLTNLFSSMS